MTDTTTHCKLLSSSLIVILLFTSATVNTFDVSVIASTVDYLDNDLVQGDIGQSEIHDAIPPVVTIPNAPKPVYIEQYSTNTAIECQADGNPKPTFSWYKNGELLISDDYFYDVKSNGTLIIKNFHTTENGYFQCKARNQYGTSLSQILHIQQDIMPDSRTNGTFGLTTLDDFKVQEGDPFSLSCDVKPDVPRHMIKRWYSAEEQMEVQLSERVGVDVEGTMRVAYSRKEDQRKYSCGIIPESGYLGRTIHLFPKGTVMITPKEDDNLGYAKPTLAFKTTQVKAILGRSAILECFFSAKPVARITWKNSSNHDITHGSDPRFTVQRFGRKLLIHEVRQVDQGNFVCTGTNDYGSEEGVLTVNVTSKPMIIKGGILLPRTVPDKRDITLPCKTVVTSGESMDTPRWYRNGKPLTQANVPSSRYRFSSNYQELHIQNATKPDDTANFQCNTSNSEGYVFFDAYLRVINSIVITKRPADVNQIAYGDTVDISVEAKGDVCCRINIMWLFNENAITTDIENLPPIQRVPNTGQLIFNTSLVTEEELQKHFGLYTCRVSNQHQSISVDFRILAKTSRTAPKTEIAKSSSGPEIWWIGLVAGLVLILIVVVIVVVIYKSKNPGETYKLEKQELKHNLNPEEDLLNQSFHEI